MIDKASEYEDALSIRVLIQLDHIRELFHMIFIYFIMIKGSYSHTFSVRRSLLIFFMLFITSSISFSQQPPKIEWQKCFGGSNSEDSSNINYSLHSILQTQDGFILAGETQSNDGNVSGNHGGDDLWLLELSSSGGLLRQKCFGSAGNDGGSRIIHTSDAGFAVLGWSNANDGDVSGNHGGMTDLWLLKLDFFWHIQWQKCIGGTGWELPGNLIQTSDGGYIVSDASTSNDEGFFNRGYSDEYIVKLDSSGSNQWQKLYGGTFPEGANTIMPTSDKGYIVVGTTASKDSIVLGDHLDSTGNSTLDTWIFKLDSIGQLQWQKCIGGTGSDLTSSFIRTFDGGYILCGSTTSEDGDVIGHHHSLRNSSDAWVIKFDSSFNITWQKCLGGSNWDAGYSIIQTIDSGYLMCGTTLSEDGDVKGFHSPISKDVDSTDIWIVKLSPLGAIQWQKCLGGTNADYGYAAIQAKDGGFVVYGRTSSNDGDVSGNHGKEDIWVIKLSPEKNAVENSVSGTGRFAWVYPNPSQTEIRLPLFDPNSIVHIGFYNLMGIECFPPYKVENTTLIADIYDLATGPYFVRVSYSGRIVDEVRKFFHYH